MKYTKVDSLFNLLVQYFTQDYEDSFSKLGDTLRIEPGMGFREGYLGYEFSLSIS